MEFSFQGSKIEIHGLMDSEGANMMIQLDSNISGINTSTGAGGTSLEPTILFSQSGLDSDVVHTLSVGWVGNGTVDTSRPSSYVYLDHVVVWNYRAVAITSSSDNSTDPFPPQASVTAGTGQGAASATASSSPIGTSSAKSSVNPGIFVGVTLACIALIVVFVCGSVLFLRRRRRLRSPSARFRLWVTTHTESQVDGPPSPPPSMLEAKPYMSLPPAYRTETKAVETRESKDARYREGMSYLDLEPGTSVEGSIGFAAPEVQSRDRQAVKVSIPQRVHLKESELTSPYTPFTPYTVRVGQVIRPQYSQATLVAPNNAENEHEHEKQSFPSALAEKTQLTEIRATNISANAAELRGSSSTYMSPNSESTHSEAKADLRLSTSTGPANIVANMRPYTLSAPPPPYDLRSTLPM